MLSLKQGAPGSVMMKKLSHQGLFAPQPILDKLLPAPIHLSSQLSLVWALDLAPSWQPHQDIHANRFSLTPPFHCPLLSNPPTAADFGFLSTSPNPTHKQKFLPKTFSLQPVLSFGSHTPARALFLSNLVATLALTLTIGWTWHKAS